MVKSVNFLTLKEDAKTRREKKGAGTPSEIKLEE